MLIGICDSSSSRLPRLWLSLGVVNCFSSWLHCALKFFKPERLSRFQNGCSVHYFWCAPIPKIIQIAHAININTRDDLQLYARKVSAASTSHENNSFIVDDDGAMSVWRDEKRVSHFLLELDFCLMVSWSLKPRQLLNDVFGVFLTTPFDVVLLIRRCRESFSRHQRRDKRQTSKERDERR